MIGPEGVRRIAEVRRLRIDAALLILTDWCAIDEKNFRDKIDEAKRILQGHGVIARED